MIVIIIIIIIIIIIMAPPEGRGRQPLDRGRRADLLAVAYIALRITVYLKYMITI